MEFIDKKEFTKAAMDKNSKVFVVHIAASEASKPAEMPIHPSRATQIASQSPDKPTLPALKWNKAPTEILSKYLYYTHVFWLDLAIELPKNTSMNEHPIELMKSK